MIDEARQFQHVETVVQTLVGKPLTVIICGLWFSGRFIAKKSIDLVARLRTRVKTTEGKSA